MPVHGDCLSTRGYEEVSISGLKPEGCEIMFVSGIAPEVEQLTIWIGAIGPIEAMIVARREAMATLEFLQMLDERVTRHFAFS